MVPRHVRTALTADLRAFADPDKMGDGDGSYTVRSLYLDSPDWHCVTEKAAGVDRRSKLRLRAYPDAGNAIDAVKFEIKHRRGGRIGKEVATASTAVYEQLLPLLHMRAMPDCDVLDATPRLHSFFAIKQRFAMVPTFCIEFRRQAFTVRTDPHVRITLDDRLIGTHARDVHSPLPLLPSMLGPLDSVFEVKFPETMPAWLQRLLRKYALHARSVSKYVHGAQRGPFGLDALL